MSWKDYFYFTKTERNGITVLIIVIVLVIFSPVIFSLFHQKKPYSFDEFEQRSRKYEKLLAEYLAAKEFTEAAPQTRQSWTAESLTPFAFDPNTLTLEEFVNLGLSERIAQNIINFREAGGSFRVREDFQRIYSINDEIYARLENYITLPSRADRQTYYSAKSRAEKGRHDTIRRRPSFESFRDIVIDINRADTMEWQKIRGIGPVFSKRITSYRDLLGGFYSTEQLLEVFGMDSMRFAEILPHISLDSVQLTRININHADFVALVKHPYIDRNQANSIVRMRERHGLYQSVADIKRSELISEEQFARVAPYLTVKDSLP